MENIFDFFVALAYKLTPIRLVTWLEKQNRAVVLAYVVLLHIVAIFFIFLLGMLIGCIYMLVDSLFAT